MAADTAHVHHDVPCPDPSVHEKTNKLSEQASSAALYVTHPERAVEAREYKENPLGPDGKLSSKSAAASLKYAKAQDLPSFPSHGTSADSAGKAAMVAKDYKMKELWQPEQSLAGSKAAILAAGRGGKLDLWQASATAEGHSAATLAMRNKGLSPVAYSGVDADNRNRALRAATMSHSLGRQRAESSPATPPAAYPDAHNSVANALNAATVSHRTSTLKSTGDGWDSQANQAARIKNSHMDRLMFSEHPPVDVGNEEAKHQAALRASAVSMAKQIYDTQDRNIMVADTADVAGAQAAAGRSSVTTTPTDLKQEAMRYISLQETAHKLAAERLAKVDKSFEDSRYREYYGYGDKPKRLSSRMSLRSVGGRQRKRASSEGNSYIDEDDSDDEEQARRIRSQMSQLNSGLNQVDQKKQQDDRARLLAAAEKRVSARMHNMDEKVFADTGKVSPALMEEWEAKARERAQKEREIQAQNPGKTHIGGGKFMDQSEIEAIAAARLKPTLDEINDTAEKKRARDEELRQEKEEQERQKREDKASKKEEKDEQKRVKNEEKARKAEEKRVAKEDKRKSRDVKDVAAAGAAGATLGEVANKVKDDNDEEEPMTDGVQKHRSALSRLKERFRKSNAPEGDGTEASEENPLAPSTDAAVGGATTGATLAEAAVQPLDAQPEPLDSQQAAHAVAQEESDGVAVRSPVSPVAAEEASVPVGGITSSAPVTETQPIVEKDDKWKPVEPATAAAAIAATIPATTTTAPEIHVEGEDEEPSASKAERPPFEQKPSLSGYHNDEVESALDTHRPDLERHISQIPESDGDPDDDDEDWNDANDEALGQEQAHVVANRVGTAPVAAVSTEPPLPTNGRTDETLAQLNDQRAEPPHGLPETLTSPGVPVAAPLAEDTETKLETDPAHKEHTILRQIVNPGGKKYDEEAFGETAHEVPVTVSTGNKEAEKPIAAQQAGVAGASNAPTSKLTKKIETEAKSPINQESEKDKKGFRGFFNRLGSRKSKSENKYPEFKSASKSVPYENHAEGKKPTTETANGSAVVSPIATGALPTIETGSTTIQSSGTDASIADKEKVSGINSSSPETPESPSSFRRGETSLNDPDDVSSSGVDEDDFSRGRGGQFARRLGFGSRKNGGKDAAGRSEGANKLSVATTGHEGTERQNSGTEDETFEEARDHFDENLAPPPAFAGQAKSESPVRGTKFQEQL